MWPKCSSDLSSPHADAAIWVMGDGVSVRGVRTGWVVDVLAPCVITGFVVWQPLSMVVRGGFGIAGALSASGDVSNTPLVPYLLSGILRAALKVFNVINSTCPSIMHADKQIQYRHNSI